jgi:hypothetical protein
MAHSAGVLNSLRFIVRQPPQPPARQTNGIGRPESFPTPTPARPILKRPSFWVLVVIAALVAEVSLHNFVFDRLDRLSKTPISIVYTVTGSEFASASYDTFIKGDKGTVQDPVVLPPWAKKVNGHRPFGGFTVDLTASNPTKVDTSITCEISVNGRVVSRHSAHGSFAAASCSAIYF